MSFDRYNGRRKDLQLPTLTVSLRPLSVKHFLRLLGIFQKLQKDLGFTQEDVEKLRLNPDTIRAVTEKVVNLCVGEVDLNDPNSMGKNAKIVFGEFSAILGLTTEELMDADLDDLVEVMVGFWEVNSSGPLGQRVRAITERLKPQLEQIQEVLALNFQMALMRAIPHGGTTDGGTTGSSSPSTSSSDGESETSSNYPSSESSTSSPASDTSESSKPQSSEKPNEIPEETEELLPTPIMEPVASQEPQAT